ncbi:hypothetical protein J7373_01515 [Xanthomonas sp. A2111]|uniref:HEAT repeat domain-containing protein n=1 Tax=Xanthomonas hawaiiensis TaxID=3003247 RepID=A0ABU2I3Y5_9XANT|nr:hypothetical protein [Xanthomonas sp. A2111]MBO9826922.1 hypothetical protein [Xanthomonas sp. A2111]MDS9992860.1 hypothetical protein [Xanthomonas sp. A2111]
MAITPKLSAQTRSIPLDAFLEKARSTVDVQDPESALALADDLASLAMNETLVTDAIEAQVNGFLTGTRQISYTPQSIILGGGDEFYVRANIWTPPRLSGAIKEQEERIFSYNLAHDHNFAFLTVGYFGAGYSTEIFDYDPKKITGYIGEKVDITPLEKTTLPKGKVMFYRMRRDIHIQHPPEELSISLNLMIISPESQHTEQYFFDTNAGVISGIPEAAYVYRHASLATLLGEVGNETSLPLLHSLLENQPNRRVRISALQSIYRLHERLNQSTTIASKFVDDQDTLVADAARRLSNGEQFGADLDLALAADLYKRD